MHFFCPTESSSHLTKRAPMGLLFVVAVERFYCMQEVGWQLMLNMHTGLDTSMCTVIIDSVLKHISREVYGRMNESRIAYFQGRKVAM